MAALRDQFWVLFGEATDMLTAAYVMINGQSVGNSFIRAAARVSNAALGRPISTRVRVFRLLLGATPEECEPIPVYDGSIYEMNGYVTNRKKYSIIPVQPNLQSNDRP